MLHKQITPRRPSIREIAFQRRCCREHRGLISRDVPGTSLNGSTDRLLIIRSFLAADKQQELDLPSLRIEDAVAATGSADARAAKKKDRVQRGPAAMSHISGVKRPLTHTNSFTGERVPLYGVETSNEEELGKVTSRELLVLCCNVWFSVDNG